MVEAASLHAQVLTEAPANVTVIGEEEIARYGYRTLGEALSSARGFYMVNDRTYTYVGLRGFLTPGDNNTRFLVMINGHYMTENIYDSNNYFGQDFGLDMDLVKRIEIIRGGGSALYGTNGILCTINVVTKSPVDHPHARVSTEVGSFGEKKVQIASSTHLGGGVNLLWSMSVFNNSGQSLYFPEFDAPQTHNGWARGADGEKGYHGFVSLVWRNWAFTGLLSSREKNDPFMPWTPVDFGSRGNKIFDQRGLVEASYRRDIRGGELRWRMYYDGYRWGARYDRDTEEGMTDTRDRSQGDWAGTQITYSFAPHRFGKLILGAEASRDITAIQQTDLVSPRRERLLDLSASHHRYGLFAQDELALSSRWTAFLGIRFDENFQHRDSVSPRIALVFRQSETTVWKLLYSRAFRNASVYETDYHDVGQTANPDLGPEKAHNFEVAMEKN